MSERGDEILEGMREALEWSQGKRVSRVSRFCPLCGARIGPVEIKRQQLGNATCSDCGWQEQDNEDKND